LLFILFALWPVAGWLVISLVNRYHRQRDRSEPIPPTGEGGEILLRMYLWPVVLYRYLRGQR
jgi:hypothetical protein